MIKRLLKGTTFQRLPSSSVMVTIDMAKVPSMKIVKLSFPSSATLSFTIRSVKSIQDTGPGGSMVMVVPSVKSESEKKN